MIMKQKFKKKMNYCQKSSFSRKYERFVKNMQKKKFNKTIKISTQGIKNNEW